MTTKTTLPKVLFYVQHLLGIGHVIRSFRVAKALAQGFEVTIALGGPAIAGIESGSAKIVQLPPIIAGKGGFGDLVDANNHPIDETYKQLRTQKLLTLFDEINPDILLIEAFPFGRRAMRFELLPLLERAKSRIQRPLIASSVRDIVQCERRRGILEQYCQLVEDFFDLIIVHADQDLILFQDSFQLAARIADKITYSGIVAPDRPQQAASRFGIVVSAGGGAVGADLLRCALQAKPLSPYSNHPWLMITGPNAPEILLDELQQTADSNVEIRRFVADLPKLFATAALSISQAGYNTIADLMVANCPALLVPFKQGNETEQSQRAEIFQARGWAVIPKDDSVAAMGEAMEKAKLKLTSTPNLNLNGALATCNILQKALRAVRAGLHFVEM